MAEGFRIASAFVTVDADTDPANRKIDALIAKLGSIPDKTIKVDVDPKGTAAGAAKVKAAVDALTKKPNTVKLGAETGDTVPKLTAVDLLLRTIRDHVNIPAVSIPHGSPRQCRWAWRPARLGLRSPGWLRARPG
jgi:hypothetical protein